jgi:hypothetical protein
VIWAYTAAGLVALIVVAAIVVASIGSVKSKGSFAVRLDVPEYYGYAGEITARVDSEEDAYQLMLSWRGWIEQDQKGDEPAKPLSTRERLTQRGLLP